jgi:hypothetical protein
MLSPRAVRFAGSVSVATMLCTIASCATYPTQLTTNTVGLPLCDAHNTPKTRYFVTIRLHRKIDDVFDRGARSEGNVFYGVRSEPSDAMALRNDLSVKNEHFTSTYPDVNTNPYDSDLGYFHDIRHGDKVQYRIVLDNDKTNVGDNSANDSFYQETNALGNGDDVRGVAVIPRSRSKFVCSRLNLGETDPFDNKVKDVAYFYITYRHDPETPTFDSFSVFLVPKAGATTTVVIIDPKIMNSG